MLNYNILISFLLFTATVFCSNKMTFYGCPEECHTQENPSCGNGINTDYFAALSTSIGDFCDKYVVVMETKSNAKKLVRAKVVDTCSSCPTYHVDLSKKAFTTLTEAKVGKSEIIWGIYDGSGKLVKGPFYNSVNNVASSYGLSSSSFVSAFKIAAGKLASNGSSSGNFSISRESADSGNTEETKKTTSKKVISVTTKITTTAVEKKTKVITTVIVKKPASTPAPSDNTQEVPANNNTAAPSNNNNNDNNNQSTPTNTDNSATALDGGNNDSVVVDANAGSNVGSPTVNNSPSKSPIVINSSDNADNNSDEVHIGEIDEDREGGGNTGATVGVLTAITCIGAGGAGLMFMKKRNPNKYDELKKRFPEALSRSATTVKNGLKRSVTKMRGRSSDNVTLPSHNTYMPADTIGDDGLPRISLYDNPPSQPMQHVN